MLVLSRKLNEEVVIGENVRIKIVEIAGGRIRLGIDAPKSVPVLRGELKTEHVNEPDEVASR